MTNAFAVSLYAISLLFQITAVYFSYRLFRKATIYQIPCFLLMLGFLLMVLRGIYPMIYLHRGATLNVVDAVTAVTISGLIMLGMQYMIRAFTSIEDQSHIFELDAKIDAMTGALRQGETVHCLEQEISRCFRNRQPVALIMIDIDHFKFVNDRYGHLVGDVVLKNLVTFYQRELRDIDIFGRVGGEEFLAILPNTDATDALDIAERLRKGVEDLVVARVNHKLIKITISSGITILNPDNELNLAHAALAKKYFQQADLAMYQAKQLGRNQSVIWKEY
jgi:diguanylate cyclase (GGDEF)-like protein